MLAKLIGQDFMGANQTLTFSSGDESGSTLVFIIDDNEYEGIENFHAILTSEDSAVEVFQPNADITIVDDGRCVLLIIAGL